MSFSELCIRRPVFATVLSLLLIAFGILAFFRLPLREYPDIDPPIVSIETTYPGASAAVVESRITQVLEDQLSGIEGVKTISSRSRNGRSDISIEFNLDRDIDDAANDVRGAVSRVQDRLPNEIDAPEVAKADADAQVIVWYNLTSTNFNDYELSDYAERFIVDRLQSVNGVARLNVGGDKVYAMRVWIDRRALAARKFAISDIEAALARENVELPGGSLETRDQEINIRLTRAYSTEDDFRKLVIRESNGYLVRLGDVARVELGAVEYRGEFRGNRVPQVSLGVIKQSRANTLEVARETRAEIERIRPTLPEGTEVFVAYDSSVFIEEAISEVYKTLAIALALVLAVIFIFLGSLRASIIPAITVPVSLTGAFIALAAFGFSINLLTLLALVLAIGLVVDDSIVVLENIQRRIDEGEHPLLGARNGTRQVTFAVIASTIALVSVFSPLIFLQDTVGRLFSELAVALTAAVVFSGFVALSLTPMMCSKLLLPTVRSGPIVRTFGGLIERATGLYMTLARRALDNRFAVLIVFIAVLGASFVMFRMIPSELAPPEDRGIFFVRAEGPKGASYEYMQKQMLQVEDIMMGLIETSEVRRVLLRTPGGGGSGGDFNTGAATVILKDFDDREANGFDIVAQARRELAKVPGIRTSAVMRQGLGNSGPSGRPVQFVIGGPSYEELVGWRDIILEAALESGLLINPQSDYEETRPELRLEIDRDRAADFGVSVADVGNTLQTLFGSRRITRFIHLGEEREVILQAQQEDRNDTDDLSNVYVRSSRTDALVPLSNIVTWRRTADSDELPRFNRLRAVTISADLAPGVTLGEALAYLEGVVRERLPVGAQVDYKGQSAQFKEAGGSLLSTFALALLVVFLVLAAQFESWRHPFIVMLTVPLAVGGALFGLLISAGTLNIYSQIGIIMLIGIATKNGILVVEFANQLRDEGLEIRDAVLEAARTRFRPIIMTSLSTAIGAVPLALATGAGSESRATIGIVIFWGVAFATFLTLILIPVVYDLFARGTQSPETVGRALEALERGEGTPA